MFASSNRVQVETGAEDLEGLPVILTASNNGAEDGLSCRWLDVIRE